MSDLPRATELEAEESAGEASAEGASSAEAGGGAEGTESASRTGASVMPPAGPPWVGPIVSAGRYERYWLAVHVVMLASGPPIIRLEMAWVYSWPITDMS